MEGGVDVRIAVGIRIGSESDGEDEEHDDQEEEDDNEEEDEEKEEDDDDDEKFVVVVVVLVVEEEECWILMFIIDTLSWRLYLKSTLRQFRFQNRLTTKIFCENCF